MIDFANALRALQGIFKRPSSGSTANLLEFQTEAGTVMLAVDKDGRLVGRVTINGTPTDIPLYPLGSFNNEPGWAASLIRVTGGRFDFVADGGNRAEMRVIDGGTNNVFAIFNVQGGFSFFSATKDSMTLPGTLTLGDGTVMATAPDEGLEVVSSAAGGWVTGTYYDNVLKPGALGLLASTAGQIRLSPFFVAKPLTVDRLGFEVTTAQSSGTDSYFVGVYDSVVTGTNAGWPRNRVAISPSISGATVGMASQPLGSSFTFLPGVKYWLALHSGGNATTRVMTATGAMPIGGKSADAGTGYFISLLLSQAIGTPMPAAWTFASSQRSTGTPPVVAFRAA